MMRQSKFSLERLNQAVRLNTMHWQGDVLSPYRKRFTGLNWTMRHLISRGPETGIQLQCFMSLKFSMFYCFSGWGAKMECFTCSTSTVGQMWVALPLRWYSITLAFPEKVTSFKRVIPEPLKVHAEMGAVRIGVSVESVVLIRYVSLWMIQSFWTKESLRQMNQYWSLPCRELFLSWLLCRFPLSVCLSP